MSEIARYRKRAVTIEALHYEGGFDLELLRGTNAKVASAGDGTGACVIYARDGDVRVEIGEWVIRGIAGGLSVLDPDDFDATYERVVS